MKRMIVVVLVVAFAMPQFSALGAQGQGAGVIQGTATGPNNAALAGARVNVLNANGMVVGTTTTAPNGAFTVSGLQPGTFTVQVVNTAGNVVGTSTATLAAGAMTATVSVSATAGALAGAAGAAAGAAGATAGGISTTAIVIGVAAAAGTVGIVAAVATKDEASGSR